MHVGQVDFAVEATSLDEVLGKARELDAIVNSWEHKRMSFSGLKNVSSELAQLQRDMEHTLVNFGSRMQTLGRTLQNVTAPFNSIVRGFTMGIGYRALNKVIDGFTGAFSRADILNTAATRIKKLGLGKDLGKEFAIGTNEAATAMENLEQAVLGLPTGLDEIVASMQVYVGASEDVEKSTRMAIAANNAYIASGVDATRKRYSERQLQNLMSGTELTSQQWDSLRKNIPLALNATAHALHMTTGEMISDLKNGRMEADKFIDAFIQVGTEGKVAEAAQVMKVTWEGLSSNISIAFSRMGANIINTMNDVTKKLTGRTFLEHLLGVDKNGKDMGDGIKGIIDGISESAQNWIKANPEKILGFLNGLKNFDWQGLFSEMGKFVMFWGKMYGGIIKFIGGKWLARFMLWGNALGKFLTVFGGLTRGLAGPISKFLTGTGIFRVVKGFQGLGKLGTAMESVSWQAVGAKAVGVAAIPAMAWSLKEVALAFQEFDKIKLSGDLALKITAAAGAITAFGAVAAAMGALTTGHFIGWITTAGTAVGMAEMAGISKTMRWIGEGLTAIADAKLPSMSKLQRVMTTLDEVGKHFKSTNPLEAIGKAFDAWEKSKEYKAIKHMGEAITSIDEALRVPIKTGWQDRAITRLGHLFDVVDYIETRFDEQDAKLMQGSDRPQAFAKGSKAKKAQETYTYRKQRLNEFAEYAKTLSDGLGDLSTAISNIYSFNKVWAKLDKNNRGTVDWDVFEVRIGGLINTFYRLASSENGEPSPLQKLRQVAEQLKGGGYDKITEALGEIPKIIVKLAAIQKKITTSSLFDNSGIHNLAERHNPLASLTTQLVPVFRAIASISSRIPKVGGLKRLGRIKTALEKLPQLISQLKGISQSSDVGGINVASIHEAVTKIKEALAEIESLNDEKVNLKVTIKGKVDNKAVDTLNKEFKKTKEAIDQFDKLPKKKTVNIQLQANITGKDAIISGVKSAIDGVIAAIASIPSSTSKSINVALSRHGHAVEHNGGRIHPLYRAHGGSIYNSRGTDIVPAMLTPGEFVLNRMAASRIGADALWKLNHMDIAGAIRDLSLRVGQSIAPHGNIINNTTNNTRNATVNLHNYNGGSMGTVRASRWANQL